MKFIKRIITAILVFFVIITTSSCNLLPKRDPSQFDNFSRQVFDLVIGTDEFAINYYFKNPENYGIDHGEPYLPIPTTESNALGTALLNVILGQVKHFNYNELSFDQKMTYHLIEDLIDKINDNTTDRIYLDANYLGSYLGYQAQLPILFLQYNFRSETDIINYFAFLDLVPETFKAYVEFEKEKANHGYGMPDFVIENVVGQCEGFLKNIDDTKNVHFMITEVNKKIDEVDFLSSDLKAYYKSLNESKVRGPLKEGYQYVVNNLPSLKGRATNNMGLAHYVGENNEQIGKNYYQKIFQEAVGYDVTIDEALAYIEGILEESYLDLRAYANIIKNDPEIKYDSDTLEFMPEDIEGQLEYYKNSFVNVPEISKDLVINIKYVDESIADYFSPAAYVTSAIDEHVNEFIYLNRSSITITDELGQTSLNTDYLVTTLAHEGYPGHLYQNVYFKSTNPNLLRLLIGNTGYKEGWANYAERLAYDLYFDNHDYDDAIRNYYIENLRFEAAFYTKLDIGIHYLGWTLEETASYINTYFEASEEDCIAIYQQLIEVPTNYPTYFYTYLKINDLRDYMLSKGYSLYDFHKAYLDCGPVPLKYVESSIKEEYK